MQHALRAFTAKDRKEIKQVAENYPLSDFYDVDQTLTQLGIGEAFVTVLNEKGIPTPLVHCLLCAPQSRMDVLSQSEIEHLIAASPLRAKYSEAFDRDSAHEMLARKVQQAAAEKEKEVAAKPRGRAQKPEPSTFEQVMKSPVTNTVIREVTRGLLGILGFRTTTRRRR